MSRLQVAIVLPAEWFFALDENDSLVVATDEIRDALDEIEDAHPEFEIVGMFVGSDLEKQSSANLRIYIGESGHIEFSRPPYDSPEPGRPLGEDLNRVKRSGLWATIEKVMTAYNRKYGQRV